MIMVLIAAVVVGGATILGSLLGFAFKGTSHRFSDITLSFGAGIMLAASIFGLIVPSLEMGGKFGLLISIAGIFAGAGCMDLLGRCVPALDKLVGMPSDGGDRARADRVLLFVMAIAIHNLPEGIAAGTGFGTGDMAQAMMIAGGIAIQNIPEGMIVIGPMLSAGISPRRTLCFALFTGVVEIVGTLIGYFMISLSSVILPFVLALAGGTMIFVISEEMIPETHADGNARGATYALLVGFCAMLVVDVLMG